MDVVGPPACNGRIRDAEALASFRAKVAGLTLFPGVVGAGAGKSERVSELRGEREGRRVHRHY